MAEMSKYCKAYEAKDLMKFSGWEANLDNLRKETEEVDGNETEVERKELKDDDILYIHDNYTVTDGIYRDENIIFDKVTDVWKQFCEKDLSFEIPVDEPIEIPTEEPAAADDAES